MRSHLTIPVTSNQPGFLMCAHHFLKQSHLRIGQCEVKSAFVLLATKGREVATCTHLALLALHEMLVGLVTRILTIR